MLQSAGLPSIRRRVTRTLLLVTLLWSVLVTALVRQVVRHEVDELMTQGLHESAEMLHGMLALMRQPGLEQALAGPHAGHGEHLVWQIVAARTGEVVGRSQQAPERALLPDAQAQPRHTPDGAWHVVTVPLQGDLQHFLLVAQSEAERAEARADVMTYALIAALLLGVLVSTLLSVLLHREFEPLTRLSRAVAGYDPLRPATLPGVPTRTELLPIAQAIRDLGGRLAQRITSERAFTAHAAHALRTPLAGIDAQLAIALREAPEPLRPRLGRCRAAATRLSQVMQALLTMFRSGGEPRRQTVRVSELLAPLAFAEVRIDIDLDQPLDADPDLLSAVLFNLLDNAQRHQASRVVLTATRADGLQRLRLHDDGQGCPTERLEQLRAALEHQEYDSGGVLKGLGLILADLVARAHGGQIELPAVDRGFCVELSWPG